LSLQINENGKENSKDSLINKLSIRKSKRSYMARPRIVSILYSESEANLAVSIPATEKK